MDSAAFRAFEGTLACLACVCPACVSCLAGGRRGVSCCWLEPLDCWSGLAPFAEVEVAYPVGRVAGLATGTASFSRRVEIIACPCRLLWGIVRPLPGLLTCHHLHLDRCLCRIYWLGGCQRIAGTGCRGSNWPMRGGIAGICGIGEAQANFSTPEPRCPGCRGANPLHKDRGCAPSSKELPWCVGLTL